MCTDIAQNVIRTLAAEGIVFTEGVVPDAARAVHPHGPGHDHPLSRGRGVQRPGLRPPRRGVDGGGLLRGAAHGVPALSRGPARRAADSQLEPHRGRDSRLSRPACARRSTRTASNTPRRERRGCTDAAAHRDGSRRDAARPPHVRPRAGPGRAGTGRAGRHPARAVLEQDPRGDRGAAAAPRSSTTRSSPRTAGPLSRRSATSTTSPTGAVVDGGRFVLALGRPYAEVVRRAARGRRRRARAASSGSRT